MNYDDLKKEVVRLTKIMEKLRGPEGCPWDKKQNYYSLEPYIIEEAYEVVETLQKKDINSLREELGDLLLQVIFQAQIGKENDDFDLIDVFSSISNKLIRRHPHVFGELELKGADEVKATWDKIKSEENNRKDDDSLMDNYKKSQPATNQAYEIQENAARVGFDWNEVNDVIKKIEEELYEIKEAVTSNKKDEIKDEIGDILFAVINLARFYEINPELALLSTINKFRKRFKFIEKQVKKSEDNFTQLTLAELDKFWEESKTREREE